MSKRKQINYVALTSMIVCAFECIKAFINVNYEAAAGWLVAGIWAAVNIKKDS